MLNEGDTIKFNTKKEPDPTHLPFHAKNVSTPILFFQSEFQLKNLKNTPIIPQSSVFAQQKICYLSTCEISPEYFKKSGRIKQTAMELVQEYKVLV